MLSENVLILYDSTLNDTNELYRLHFVAKFAVPRSNQRMKYDIMLNAPISMGSWHALNILR